MVVKSQDVVFVDLSFLYGLAFKPPSSPVLCELPWPVGTTTGCCGIDQTPTPDLPFLDIQLEPRSDRRLEASIHNPTCARETPRPQTPEQPRVVTPVLPTPPHVSPPDQPR